VPRAARGRARGAARRRAHPRGRRTGCRRALAAARARASRRARRPTPAPAAGADAPSAPRPARAGPYEHNGVPLRRVNASYVIATSTKVDVSKVQDINTIDEAVFSAKADKKAKAVGKSLEKFQALQAAGKKSGAPSEERAALQKKVDGAIVLSKDKKEADEVAKYLKARFSLTNNDRPHAMKF